MDLTKLEGDWLLMEGSRTRPVSDSTRPDSKSAVDTPLRSGVVSSSYSKGGSSLSTFSSQDDDDEDEGDDGGVRKQLRGLKELYEMGLLNEQVYTMQQEALVSQLFGLSIPAPRLEDWAPTGQQEVSAKAAGRPREISDTCSWKEPLPRGRYDGAHQLWSESGSDGEVDSAPQIEPAVGALARPRGRRGAAAKARARRREKSAARPRPGGTGSRAAGPPYRDDPVGPLVADVPGPEPELSGQRRQEAFVFGWRPCTICGAARQRDCKCARKPVPPEAAPTALERFDGPTRPSAAELAHSWHSTTGSVASTAIVDPNALAIASSEYDFKAPSAEYISLTKGCELVVTGSSEDPDWLHGYVSRAGVGGQVPATAGKIGLFPSACVIIHAGNTEDGDMPPPPPDEDSSDGVAAPPPPAWDPDGAGLFGTSSSEGEREEAARRRLRQLHGPAVRILTAEEIVKRREHARAAAAEAARRQVEAKAAMLQEIDNRVQQWAHNKGLRSLLATLPDLISAAERDSFPADLYVVTAHGEQSVKRVFDRALLLLRPNKIAGSDMPPEQRVLAAKTLTTLCEAHQAFLEQTPSVR